MQRRRRPKGAAFIPIERSETAMPRMKTGAIGAPVFTCWRQLAWAASAMAWVLASTACRAVRRRPGLGDGCSLVKLPLGGGEDGRQALWFGQRKLVLADGPQGLLQLTGDEADPLGMQRRCLRSSGWQPICTIVFCQVLHDGGRFCQHEIPIFEHRHLAARV